MPDSHAIAFTWGELKACLEALAGTPDQVALAARLAAGLSETAEEAERLELLEMIMVAAFLVQADDPSELILAAQALSCH